MSAERENVWEKGTAPAPNRGVVQAPSASVPGTAWPRFSIRQVIVVALIMVASLGLYLSVEWLVDGWRGPEAALVTQTAWDRAIPFRVEWVWVYMIPYLIGPLVFGLASRETFLWYIVRALPLVLVSLIVFAALPTKTVRPDLTGLGDGPSAHLYRNMITIDGPAANAAPSLHVSLTCLLFLALLRDFPRWWVVSMGGVFLVWASTLLIHQHHLIDVASAILLAGLFALPWGRLWAGGETKK